MRLFLFNPSHDEALASNLTFYTPTRAARRLESEWAELPAIYAETGDAVLVPEHFAGETTWREDVARIRPSQLTPGFWNQVEGIGPWGWDAAICQRLRQLGAPEGLLPSTEQLAAIRRLSSRRLIPTLLPAIRGLLAGKLPAIGESRWCETIEEVELAMRHWHHVMLKAPWSCSGRGVWPASLSEAGCMTEGDRLRVARVLRLQHGIEVEPCYERLADFALEFLADGKGKVSYLAPSLFTTLDNGAYAGNLVAQPERLIGQVEGFSPTLLHPVVDALETVLGKAIGNDYKGPLGVDLMTVKGEHKPIVHPCVEVNLRTTMGYAAHFLERRKLNAESLPATLRGLWHFCPPG